MGSQWLFEQQLSQEIIIIASDKLRTTTNAFKKSVLRDLVLTLLKVRSKEKLCCITSSLTNKKSAEKNMKHFGYFKFCFINNASL